jgi:signal transduction histidine kinase
MIAWSSTRIDTLRWTIGVAVPLTAAANLLRELAQRLLSFALATLLILGSAAAAVARFQRKQLERAEHEQLTATLGKLRDQLMRAEKLSMIGRLASGVAHEIGTPLGVIAIRVDQLLTQLDSEKHKGALAIVKHEIARINRIIQQLLDFSRPRQSLVRTVPLDASVGRVRALIEHRYDQKDVELSIDVEEDLTIRADPDQLEQVLLNVLLNACDACRAHDAVALRGRRSAERPGHILVEVRDSGAGIPEELLAHIFDPFFTTKAQSGGTGLGLTVAREIVENHGGTIAVASGRGGTTFSISWPAVDAPELERAGGQGETNG